MVPLPLLLALLLFQPGGVQAQAGPRTDTPRAGTFRVTFEPVITTWDREFLIDGHEQRIGASLPTTVFVHEERRVTPLGVDFGITSRISVGVRLPLVRVNTREGYPLDSAGAPADTAGVRRLNDLLADTTYAFDPLISTRKHLMYWSGDPEFEAKYRFVESRAFALSAALVMRLPWGHQDSPNNLFDLSSGDHQTDLEMQIAGELTLFKKLWLNGLVRAGMQQAGTRSRPGRATGRVTAPTRRAANLNGIPVTTRVWTSLRCCASAESTPSGLRWATTGRSRTVTPIARLRIRST
jgi:hypothetical protein